MVDKVDSGMQIAPPVRNSPSAAPVQLAETSKERQVKAVTDKIEVKQPDVKITEVARDAAAEKSHSLESLDRMGDELREAISALNAALEKTPTKALITKDEQLNRYIVRIADKASGEIVREIPSEALLKFARNLQELKGLIFDASL